MLKLDFILQIMNYIDRCLKGEKVIELMKDELGKKILGLRAKADSYLKDNGSKDKNAKDTICLS